MTLSPHPASTLATLARLASVWLVLIVLVQGLAAASALGAGAMHRHHGSALAADAPAHHHDAKERHHHAVGDAGVQAVGQEEFDAGLAQSALAWAFSLLAVAMAWSGARRPGSLLPRAALWVASLVLLTPPRRPPRG
jgi:aryl-alcohol dehydrogenase-like predicted oxidoreductase